MSARKPGSNKRAPRTSGPNGKCISIMPDGSASFFTPKKRDNGRRMEIIKGKRTLVVKEKALR